MDNEESREYNFIWWYIKDNNEGGVWGKKSWDIKWYNVSYIHGHIYTYTHNMHIHTKLCLYTYKHKAFTSPAISIHLSTNILKETHNMLISYCYYYKIKDDHTFKFLKQNQLDNRQRTRSKSSLLCSSNLILISRSQYIRESINFSQKQNQRFQRDKKERS